MFYVVRLIHGGGSRQLTFNVDVGLCLDAVCAVCDIGDRRATVVLNDAVFSCRSTSVAETIPAGQLDRICSHSRQKERERLFRHKTQTAH